MGSFIEWKLRQSRHAEALAKLGNINGRSNANALHSDLDPSAAEPREPLTPRSFVRLFGDKVKHYRLTNRADFVGLMLLGKSSGIVVKRDADGLRYVARVDVVTDASVGKQCRFLEANKVLALRKHDSVSNLQRGLLKWIY